MSYKQKKDLNPLACNILKFQRYNFDFFSTDEVILFEYLLVKYISFKFREFYHSDRTIFTETGIKRTRLEVIRARFIKMGFLEMIVKGFPLVHYYKLDFYKIERHLSSIFRTAENCQLFVDFFKLKVENNKQKNNSHTEVLIRTTDSVSDWSEFLIEWRKKINEWKKEFKLRKKIDYSFEETRLEEAFKVWDRELITAAEEYLKHRKCNQNIATFLKQLLANQKTPARIKNKNSHNSTARSLIHKLKEIFNERRSNASIPSKTLPKTGFVVSDIIIEKVKKALYENEREDIENAFVAFCDDIITGIVSPSHILRYFFKDDLYDGFTVISSYLDKFSVDYSIT